MQDITVKAIQGTMLAQVAKLMIDVPFAGMPKELPLTTYDENLEILDRKFKIPEQGWFVAETQNKEIVGAVHWCKKHE